MILVAVGPADFRRGIDGLARICREALQLDRFTGVVFVCRDRKREEPGSLHILGGEI